MHLIKRLWNRVPTAIELSCPKGSRYISEAAKLTDPWKRECQLTTNVPPNQSRWNTRIMANCPQGLLGTIQESSEDQKLQLAKSLNNKNHHLNQLENEKSPFTFQKTMWSQLMTLHSRILRTNLNRNSIMENRCMLWTIHRIVQILILLNRM